MNLNCIIVDDEPLSHEVLENYIGKIPGINLEGSFYSAVDALTFLNEHRVDLIFLDINMPELSGIGMLKSLQNPPAVIFTSAYPEYAVDGFDLNICDFLLKPFSFDRFLKAVNKTSTFTLPKTNQTGTSETLSLKTGKKLYRLKLDDIFYLESAGDYIKIVTHKKTHIANDTMKHFETLLPQNEFLRIHRSFIVHISKIEYLEGNQVFIADSALPIGSNYKEALLSRLG